MTTRRNVVFESFVTINSFDCDHTPNLLKDKVCPKLKKFKLVKILRFESQLGIFGCALKHDHFENPMHYINN